MNFGTNSAKVGTVQPFSFGTSVSNAATNPTTTSSMSILGLNLSVAKTLASTGTGFSFGGAGPAPTTVTSKLPSFGSLGGGMFGSQSTTGFSAATGTTGFGAAIGATGFGAATGTTGFGAATSTAGFGAATSTTGFGTAIGTTGFGAATSTAGFGTATGTTAFGTAASATSTPAFGFNNISSVSSSSAASSQGLGGIHLSTAPSNMNASGSTLGGGGGNFSTVSGSCGDSKHGKDIALPEEVVRTVDAFKKFLSDQKQMRDTLTKHSEAPLLRTREELGSVRRMVVQFEGELRRRIGLTRTLRQDLSRHERHISGLRRHAETPFAADASENLQFFGEYVNEAENRLLNYRQELESLEALLSGAGSGGTQSNECNPSDLAALFRRVHEGFISVAAQLQLVHEAVELRRGSLHALRRNPKVTHLPLKSVNARVPRAPRAMDYNFCGPSPFESAALGFGALGAKNGGFGTSGLVTGFPASGVSNTLASGSSLLGGNIAPPTQGLAGTFAGFGAGNLSNNVSFGGTFSSPAGGTLFGGAAASPTAASFFNKPSSGARPPSAPGITFGSENSTFGAFGTTTSSGFQLQTPPSGKKKR